MSWYGSRACRKKDFISPQWLRDTKHKKYPLWRLDIILSKTKYSSIHYVENGGWHFTNIKSPEEIEKKFSNFLHHQDFEDSGLTLDDVKEMVENKKVLYDHSVDQKDYKWSGKTTLKKISLSEMPDYLSENNKKYDEEISVEAKQGSALIFDGSLWHGGSGKTSDASRWAVIPTYGRSFIKPAFNFTENIPSNIFNQLTDERKKLLGLNSCPPKDEFTRITRLSNEYEWKKGYELPKTS